MRRAGGLFIAIIAAVWGLAVATYAFVWIADPYELRFPRPAERLADHLYPREVVPRLVAVAANGGVDMVIIGASTARGYTPGMMRQAFPDVRHPANLAFPCVMPEDFGLLLPRLAQSRTLKRVIISLDVSLITNCTGKTKTDLDPRYFVQNWSDPVPEFNLESVVLSEQVLRTGVLDLAAWRPLPDDRLLGMTTEAPLTTKPAEMADIRRVVARAHGRATAGSPLPCSAIPSLQTTIVPFVRRMATRGVAVDLLAPPFSLALYSQWVHSTSFTAPPFASVMALQRCALQMTAGLPNVRFFSFDTDLSMVGNLGLYRDTAHIRNVDTYRQILGRIASGQAQVRLDEWPQHEATLKREIDDFTP